MTNKCDSIAVVGNNCSGKVLRFAHLSSTVVFSNQSSLAKISGKGSFAPFGLGPALALISYPTIHRKTKLSTQARANRARDLFPTQGRASITALLVIFQPLS